MRIAILTSNAVRHKFFANSLSSAAEDALVISEAKASDAAPDENAVGPLIAGHFRLRWQTEREFFKGHDAFLTKTAPLLPNEVNLPWVGELVKAFRPDLAFVFGS